MADDVVLAAPATSPEPAAVTLPDEPPVADNLPMKPRMATLPPEADYSRAATDEKSTPPPRMLPAADRARIACSLLSSFDFAGKGSVSHDDWLRGISLIALWDGDSAVWQRLGPGCRGPRPAPGPLRTRAVCAPPLTLAPVSPFFISVSVLLFVSAPASGATRPTLDAVR